jgi:hypothetical protein
MKLGNGLQTKNWPFIIGGPKFWSVGCIRPYLLNIKIFFQILAFIPCVKALRLISEFQPMTILSKKTALTPHVKQP